MSKITDESVEDVLSAVVEAGFSSMYRLDEMLRLYSVIIARATNSNPPKSGRKVEYGDTVAKSDRLTTDPTDPALGHGVDTKPVPQNEKYLVLSEEERAQGFVNPVRTTYRHVGRSPQYPLRSLTEEEILLFGQNAYVAFESYPESERPKTGRFWTKDEVDNKGCGTTTTMGDAIAETYARNPKFYGSTYCVHCAKHLPVEEFTWEDGTVVGSLLSGK